MPDTGAVPVAPRPAASVIIVRGAAADAAEPIEVYMIRRQRSMKFLGGFYAFPGGKVDPGDAAPPLLQGCCGLDPARAAECFSAHAELPPLAFWVTAVRELLEESGVLLACNGAGHVVDPRAPDVAAHVDAARRALVSDAADFGVLLKARGWRCDLRPLRYLSHFVTPRTSPIRFSARFFLCRLPPGQAPRLYTEETSEGFWIHPADGYRRFLAKEMAMAEPAEYGLAYIAQFRSVDELWATCEDNREKFTGIVDRIEFQFWKDFDWNAGRWPEGGARK
jgi:8-oxo-dGTP pyrophosphatase MutT (NUDIX family)